MKIGDRVQYRSGSDYKPLGNISDELPAVLLNGAVLIGQLYKVQWDVDGESGWLRERELILIEKESGQ